MSYITIVISLPKETVLQANSDSQVSLQTDNEMNALINLLAAIAGGMKPASGYIVTRATDPAVTTDSDPNSESRAFSHL